MGKIRNLEYVKEKLKLGEVKASLIWSYDGQKNLKGNTVRSFEKDLKRICEYEVLKRGRDKVYLIKRIFIKILDREKHKNADFLKGNKNKKGHIGFNEASRSKFVASVIINKIEYFKGIEGNSYKTIGQHMKSFGLYSEKYEEVNNIVRSSFISALDKMKILGYVRVNILNFKVVNGESININNFTYEEIKRCEREEFKKLVGDEEFKIYKCIYNYSIYSKSPFKHDVIGRIREACGIEYTYRLYLIDTVEDMELSFDDKYCNVVFEVFDYFVNHDDCNVQDNIKRFVEILERNYEKKLLTLNRTREERVGEYMREGFGE